MNTSQKNQLYYGDNLTVLREHIKDESVDLIYLDPPFNSRQDYNVLFAEKSGERSASQIMAFEDTWEWNMDAERAYEEIVERGGRVSDAMRRCAAPPAPDGRWEHRISSLRWKSQIRVRSRRKTEAAP
jgi:site-specific DNA-methyltransferase (adenine-specific)